MRPNERMRIEYNRPVLESNCEGDTLTIIDVISKDKLNTIISLNIENASLYEGSLLHEIITKKKSDLAPKTYEYTPINELKSYLEYYPVFVLKDANGNICYWVDSVLATDTTIDDLALISYRSFARKIY